MESIPFSSQKKKMHSFCEVQRIECGQHLTITSDWVTIEKNMCKILTCNDGNANEFFPQFHILKKRPLRRSYFTAKLVANLCDAQENY